MNVILQTFGEMGKGEIVISGKNGEIGGGDDNNELDFELKTRGDLRYNATVAQTNLTYHLGGLFTHPVVYFYPVPSLKWILFSQIPNCMFVYR